MLNLSNRREQQQQRMEKNEKKKKKLAREGLFVEELSMAVLSMLSMVFCCGGRAV